MKLYFLFPKDTTEKWSQARDDFFFKLLREKNSKQLQNLQTVVKR